MSDRPAPDLTGRPIVSQVPEPGQTAYDAYCAAVGGRSAISGEPLPDYDRQRDDIKAAWTAAAEAARAVPATDGYRELSGREQGMVNAVKRAEVEFAQLWATVATDGDTDKRQTALAKTHAQDAFSALVKAITRPKDPYQVALVRAVNPEG